MPSTHKAVGQYMRDGVTYFELTPPEALEAVKEVEFRDDDIFLVTYPKAGTSWLSQIVSLLVNQDKIVDIRRAVPILEFSMPGREMHALSCRTMPSPRTLATHLYPSYFEKSLKTSSPRVIVLMRNPKDCLVSYYHYYRANGSLGKFQGDFSEFFELHSNNELVFGDVIKHMALWWKYRDDPRFIFLTYEQMKRDPRKAVEDLVSFLDIDMTEEKIQEVVEKTSFDKMSKDPTVNKEHLSSAAHDSSISKYLRKGAVGDWANVLTEAESKLIDERCKKELEPLGLKVEFEI